MRVPLPDRGVTSYVAINPQCTPSPSSTPCSTPPLSPYQLNLTRDESNGGDLIDRPLDENKPNLVLLHGALLDSDSFEAQFCDTRLAGAMNLVAIDMRFHGRTTGDMIKEKFSSEDCANVILETLDKLGLESYFVLGESGLGSNAATFIALKRPEKVSGMILVSPGEFTNVATPEMRKAWLLKAMQNKDGAGDGTGLLPDEEVAWMSNHYFAKGKQPDRRRVFEEHVQKRYGTGHSSHDIAHIVMDLTRELSKDGLSAEDRAAVTCPALILQGEDDIKTSPLSASMAWRDALSSAEGGADLRVIKGAPSLLLFTDYNVANRFILAFVARHHVAVTTVSIL